MILVSLHQSRLFKGYRQYLFPSLQGNIDLYSALIIVKDPHDIYIFLFSSPVKALRDLEDSDEVWLSTKKCYVPTAGIDNSSQLSSPCHSSLGTACPLRFKPLWFLLVRHRHC